MRGDLAIARLLVLHGIKGKKGRFKARFMDPTLLANLVAAEAAGTQAFSDFNNAQTADAAAASALTIAQQNKVTTAATVTTTTTALGTALTGITAAVTAIQNALNPPPAPISPDIKK